MTIESQRMRVMADRRQWGDKIPDKVPYTKGSRSPSSPSPAPSASSPAVSSPQTVVDCIHEDVHIAVDHGSRVADDLDPSLSSRSPESPAAAEIDAPLYPSPSQPNGIVTMASTRNWTLKTILDQAPNFYAVDRVSATSDALDLTEAVTHHEREGIPLVIEGVHKHPEWPQHVFTLDEFSNGTSPDINVRNVHNWTDSTLPLKDFIAKCRTSSVVKEDGETERFYGKDAECPKAWERCLQSGKIVPEILLSKRSEDVFQHLPDDPNATIETLMCYLGIGDTCTPCHKDLCASSGQNLMCYTERDGSSFWFMTESSSAPAVAEYFKGLGQELDHENYIISIQELANAPFNVYVVQQKLGDMVLVPPRSCHQVVNTGGITVKTSWSRMTLRGLSVGYHYELPIYRRVCRPETYRVKSTIYYTLASLTRKFEMVHNRQAIPTQVNTNSSGLPSHISRKMTLGDSVDSLVKDMKQLVPLYDIILVEEYETDANIREKMASKSPTAPTSPTSRDAFVCDFCAGDIFQSFFECRNCCDADGEPCHLCPGCYVEGRNCACGRMEPMQNRDFEQLITLRNEAIQAISTYESSCHRVYERPFNLLKTFPPGSAPLFRAACVLYKARCDENLKRDMQICSGGEHPHEVPGSWALNCKKCSVTKCFSHILSEYNTHCAEALLFHSADEEHDKYHTHHQGSTKAFTRESDALKRAHEQGQSPRSSGYHQLVATAMQYTRCKPGNTKYMNIGWYDKSLRTIQTTSAADTDMFSPPESDLPSTEEAAACGKPTLESEVSPHPNTSKKRKFQMYVLVPKAPYKISKIKPTGKPRPTLDTAFAHPSAVVDTNPSRPQEKDQPAPDTRSAIHPTPIASGKVSSDLGYCLTEQQNVQPITANQLSGKKTTLQTVASLKFKKSPHIERERMASTSAVELVPEQAIADPPRPSEPQTASLAVGTEAPTPSSLNSSADLIAKLVCQRVGEMFTNASQQTSLKVPFPSLPNPSFPPGHAPHQEQHGFRGYPTQTRREYRDWNNGPHVHHNLPDPPWRRVNFNNFVRRQPQNKPHPYNHYGHHEHSQAFGASPTRVLRTPDGRHQERQSWNRRETDVRHNQEYPGYMKPEKARPFRQPSDKTYHDHTSRGQYVTRGRPEAIGDRVEVHPAANEKVDGLVQKGHSKTSGEQEYRQTSPPFESHQPIIALYSSEVRESSPPMPQPPKMVNAHTKPRPEHASRHRSPSPSLQHAIRDTTRTQMNTEGSNQTPTDLGSFRTLSPSPSMDVDPRPSSPLRKSPQSPQFNIATASEDQDMDDDWEENYEKEDVIQQSPAKFRADPSRAREDNVQMYDNPWSEISS